MYTHMQKITFIYTLKIPQSISEVGGVGKQNKKACTKIKSVRAFWMLDTTAHLHEE